MKLSNLQLLTVCIIISLFFVSCKKDITNNNKTPKLDEYLLEAEYNSPLFEQTTFIIKKDSSYIFTKKSDMDFDEYSITSKGKVLIKNDTITFRYHHFTQNKSKKAILKNNLIIFLNDEDPYRLSINNTKLEVKNYYNLNQFQNYSTFTSSEFLLKYYYRKAFIDYELQNNDMIEIDKIVQTIFKENSDKLRLYKDYVIQCCAVKNDKGEIEVFVNLFCYDDLIDLGYKLSVVSMSDGGNCNVSVMINLTKKTYSNLNIAGLANGD